MERNSKLIDKKFYQYLLPSIMMIFAMQFGSLFDGVLIGNMIGSDALSATSLVMPVLFIIQIPGFALGTGGSIVVANLLGKRDVDKANKIFSACLIIGTLLSAVFSVLAPLVSKPLAKLFAESLFDYSYKYIFVYMVTDPVMMLALMLASFIATDNNPKLSAAFYIIANAVKIVTEVLFIKVCGMGIYGAALSSPVGYAIGLVTLVFYIKSKKRILDFTWKLKGIAKELKATVKAALPTALTLLLTAVQTLIINVVLSRMITQDLDLVIFGLVSNLVFVFDLFSGGIIGLIPNVCGVLYGEKDFYSLRSIVKKIYFINIAVSVLITIVIMAWPKGYTALFGFNQEEGFKQVAYILRIYLLSAIPLEINKFSTSYYPSVEKNMPSLVTVLLREAGLIIPLTLILMKTNGLFGYSLARVITEVATIVITYGVILIYNAKTKKYHGIFMFEKTDLKSLDISVENKPENAAYASKEVTDFALANGLDDRNAQIIGLATEEMISNIITYGYKKQKPNYVDVNVKIGEDVILRIRDDGAPFDPTKYEYENDDAYLTGGIALINGLADEMSYMRVLNLNNTIIKLNLGEVKNGSKN